MTDSLQIVRPLHSFETVPEYLPLLDMLMPTYCHVAYVKPILPSKDSENARKAWLARKMSKPYREQAMLRIAGLVETGMLDSQIAAEIGVSQSLVNRYVRKHDLRPARDGKKKFLERETEIRAMVEKEGIAKTGAAFHICKTTLHRYLGNGDD